MARVTPTEKARLAFAAARYDALSKYPYLGHGLMSMIPVWSDTAPGVTVDKRWHLYMNPGIVGDFPAEELRTEIVHCLWHLLRDHAGRAPMGSEMGNVWQVASCCEITDDLYVEGMPMVMDTPIPTQFGLPTGKLAEEYYELLLPMAQEIPLPLPNGGSGHGSGSDDGDYEWEDAMGEGDDNGNGEGSGVGSAAADIIRSAIAESIQNAMSNGSGRGTIPAGMARWAEKFGKPQIDWREVLRKNIKGMIDFVSGRGESTYSRPSRRQDMASKIIMPGQRKPKPEVAIVIDTSGSVPETMLGQMMTEVDAAINRAGIRELWAIPTDAVPVPQRIHSLRELKLVGGGGTSMVEGVHECLKLKPRPQVIVVLTDGYTDYCEDPANNMRVLWAVYGDGPIPESYNYVRIPIEMGN